MQDLLPSKAIIREIPLSAQAGNERLLFIQAAGRAISQKNAGRIKDAWTTLTNLLIEHEWLDSKYLLPDGGESAATDIEGSAPIFAAEMAAEEAAEAKASPFIKTVESRAWNEELRIALYEFGWQFQEYLDATPERLAMLTRRSSQDRDSLLTGLIGDLKDFLQEHATEAPDVDDQYGMGGMSSVPRYYPEAGYPFLASDRDADQAKPENTTPLQAAMYGGKSFKDTVDQLSWRDRLATTLRVFSWQFRSACCFDDNDAGDTKEEREATAAGLVIDLIDVLNQLREDHPATGSGNSPYASLELSASDGNSKKVDIQFSTSQVVLAEDSDDPVNYNRHPVEGILFCVDEPSEGIPEVGPGLPLYIPRIVADECLSQVSGLPLDAHDTLTKHAQEEPTGVMLSATIEGNNFCIKGLLWPWNKADKVTAIKAAKDALGMSMNAAAIGHEVTLNAGTPDAQKVFWITKLILLGANILYSERATYKKTRLTAADAGNAGSSADWDLSLVDDDAAAETVESRRLGKESLLAIAASAGSDGDPANEGDPNDEHDPTGESQNMNTTLIEAELSHISKGLEGLTKITSDMESLTSTVRTQGEMLTELMAGYKLIQQERDEALQKVQAGQRQEEQKQNQDSLVELIRNTIAETINPSGEPHRRTVSLQARAAIEQQQRANNGGTGVIEAVDLRIANLEGQILALQGQPNAGSTRLKLLDEVRGLKLQKQSV